jgi:hypothetical protein
MRVTDDEVRRWLAWARNYDEIESWESVARRGRRWLIRLPDTGTPVTASGMEPGWLERSVVPTELVLTGREVIAFCMGAAVARSQPRTAREKQKEWGWT